METPLVSVCMTTYNHEAWLAQAIESVLAQQTAFGVELVLGEDCSTDRTAEICRAYVDKYPEGVYYKNTPSGYFTKGDAMYGKYGSLPVPEKGQERGRI